MTASSPILSLDRAHIIKRAFDEGLEISFYAGNLYQRYSLSSVFRFMSKDNISYEWSQRWIYNARSVTVENGYLNITVDHDMVISFKIGAGKDES